MTLIKKNAAADLPEEWDALAGKNIYLKREFLEFIERTEKYNPTYWLFYDKERLDSYFVSFRMKKYNLAMFTRLNLFINVTFIYLPMSVTQSGIVLGSLKDEVFAQIKRIKGYKMILNLDAPQQGFVNGLTCPKCILDIEWDTFEDYLRALRSNYRYRMKKALKASDELTLRFIDNRTEFTDELYGMYLAVNKKSRLKIETLSKEYFEGECFKIFVLQRAGKPVGFVQLLKNGDELIFEFVGIDYSCNEQYDTYQRMLLEIVRYGIENKFKTIDFGQTADDTKLKLGSRYVYLYAALCHSNPIVNAVCKMFAKRLEYRPLQTKFNVFSKTAGKGETQRVGGAE